MIIFNSYRGIAIDLDKFESVMFRKNLAGDAYPVEALRHEATSGFFGGVQTISETIAASVDECVSKALVKDITKAWIAKEPSFDVDAWEKKMQAEQDAIFGPETENKE